VISDRLTYAPYELRFKKPLVTARGVMSVRRGFIVAAHTDAGMGIGDVAPLPEFGTETLEEAEETLKAASRTLKLESPDVGPAARFGVESARRSLGGKLKAESRKLEHQIEVNALVSGQIADEILQGARDAVSAGYGTLKIKVGIGAVREDIRILRLLREAFPETALRADANGAWSLDEARQFAHGVAGCGVEYIEDPLGQPDFETLSILRRNSDVAIACDDMARGIVAKAEIIERGLCDVMILKPSVTGSYEAMERLSAKAKARGMAVVISSALESSVGLTHLAHCAAEFGSPRLAHGIGTAGLLAEDTLQPPLVPTHGSISLPDLSAIPQHLMQQIATHLTTVD